MLSLAAGVLEGKWQEGELERARGQVQSLTMPAKKSRFHPEVGETARRFEMGEAWADGSYFSPAVHGEQLEDGNPGGGNSMESSCARPGERWPGLRGTGEQEQNLGIQEEG